MRLHRAGPIIQFVFRVCYNGPEGITNSDPPRCHRHDIRGGATAVANDATGLAKLQGKYLRQICGGAREFERDIPVHLPIVTNAFLLAADVKNVNSGGCLLEMKIAFRAGVFRRYRGLRSCGPELYMYILKWYPGIIARQLSGQRSCLQNSVR